MAFTRHGNRGSSLLLLLLSAEYYTKYNLSNITAVTVSGSGGYLRTETRGCLGCLVTVCSGHSLHGFAGQESPLRIPLVLPRSSDLGIQPDTASWGNTPPNVSSGDWLIAPMGFWRPLFVCFMGRRGAAISGGGMRRVVGVD
jgi:hypothetical protein